jgi:hypothetical protein
MLRSFALHDIPVNHIAALERWYYRDHAPEIVRRYGPWLARFECYLPVPVPDDARVYGFHNWRMTEGWWRELPEAGTENDLCFTPPAVSARVAAAFVKPQPTEHFVACNWLPLEKSCIRWLVLLRYPDGVEAEEGERWFLRVHAPELAEQPGLVRFMSYKVIQDVGNVPGRWRPDTAPPPGYIKARWDRVLELWYETFADWRQGVEAATARCTGPGWATQPQYPFLRAYEELASTFILERPNDDFLRDLRGYVP